MPNLINFTNINPISKKISSKIKDEIFILLNKSKNKNKNISIIKSIFLN